MTCKEVLNILEEQVAPVKLSDDFCAKYKMYDNSGIIIDTGNDVIGAVFSLDFSESAVNQAIEKGYNLIITHHPAIYGGISRIDIFQDAKSRAIEKCLKHGISVISMHLNFDIAPEGIDYHLMCGLGGKAGKPLATVEGGAYGRVYDITPTPAEDYMKQIDKTFRTKRAVLYGGEEAIFKRVASFCGAGCDDSAMAYAKNEKADVLVSSDLKHHEIAELVECGIAVIELTHYCAESYGFEKIYQKVKNILQMPSLFVYDERVA
ncbi:MAG: Nif3-like dinuclear metal center hexameric protein [Candidatus Coproplasma sp.]